MNDNDELIIIILHLNRLLQTNKFTLLKHLWYQICKKSYTKIQDKNNNKLWCYHNLLEIQCYNKNPL